MMYKNFGFRLISHLAKFDYRKEIIKKVNNLEERIEKLEKKGKSEYEENLKKQLEEDKKNKIEIIKKLNS